MVALRHKSSRSSAQREERSQAHFEILEIAPGYTNALEVLHAREEQDGSNSRGCASERNRTHERARRPPQMKRALGPPYCQ